MRVVTVIALAAGTVASGCRWSFDAIDVTDAQPPCIPAVSVRSLDAGHDYTCAQLTDDSLHCWGANSVGQLGDGSYTFAAGAGVVPSGLPTVSAYAVGYEHACAVRNGDVYCWGRNDGGQLGLGDQNAHAAPTLVPGLPSTMAGVAAGGLSSCAWTTAGALYCWGTTTGLASGASTVPVLVPGIPPVHAVALAMTSNRASSDSACALGPDDSMWCWGSNSAYQLADGTNVDRKTAAPAATGLTFTSIALGDAHGCGLTAAGTVYCWGRNIDGQGGEASPPILMQPTQVAITNVVELAATGEDTCARVASGDVLCWGDNDTLQLGRSGDDAVSPERIPVPPATAIAVATDHGCALGVDGVVWCWGTDRMSASSAVTVIPDTAAVAAGGYATCVRTTAGAVQCWGSDALGHLGGGIAGGAPTPDPVTVALPRPASELAVGYTHACARLDDNSVFCWGDNELGEVQTPGMLVEPPTLVGLGAIVPVSITAGGVQSCANTSAEPWCWGSSNEGVLGLNGGNVPVLPSMTMFPQMATLGTGHVHTCGITPTGDLYCAGRNNEGQIGNGAFTDVTVPVMVLTQVTALALGEKFTCAVRLAGTETYCWGEGIHGQLGLDRNASSTSPRLVPGLPTMTQLTAGNTHVCGFDTAGTVRCWGNNDYGQLGDGTRTSRLTPVIATELAGATQLSAGGRHTCALLGDGSVRCVGGNDIGQLGGGAPITSPTPRQAAITCPAP